MQAPVHPICYHHASHLHCTKTRTSKHLSFSLTRWMTTIILARNAGGGRSQVIQTIIW
ncbi:hypothetical protein C8R48DRAFT_720342 [Suillus tomentosus]|nr:hypothetical protein C8R48DRAFT_720342 [Suillus tomentosus]